MTWQERALCAGMDPGLFDVERGRDNDRALAVCRWCPVRLDCAREAVDRSARGVVMGGVAIPEDSDHGMKARKRLRGLIGYHTGQTRRAQEEAIVRRLTDLGFSATAIAEGMALSGRAVQRMQAEWRRAG